MSKLSARLLVLGVIAALGVISMFTVSTAAQVVGPPNDTFAAAAPIEGSSGYLQGTNFAATLEPTEPGACANCKTVWYRWTAPANLSMTFELVMPTVTPDDYISDTVMGVYMGSNVGSLTMLTWNDDISMERDNRRSRVTFAAQSGQAYNIRIYGASGTEGLFLLSWEINGAESWKQFNFDGCSSFEGKKSDFGVFRPSDGYWWLNSEFSPYKTLAWGLANDIPVAGDYFGDGCSDFAIWRPSDGTFWIFDNSSGTTAVARWGMQGDVPVRGDFDGDDKADLAIFRSSSHEWWILNSSDKSVRVDSIGHECWGCSEYPITGDYDGDGKTDIGLNLGGVYAGNIFLIRKSSDNSDEAYYIGGEGDYRVHGDFDRDGRDDVAVYGLFDQTFYYRRSSDGKSGALRWGVPGDIPVSGDYGGSPGSDLCVWRPSESNLYCHDPIDESNWQFKWGANGDRPLAAD